MELDLVGIDVGGTNTDAALIRDDRVLAKAKFPTDPDVLLDSITSAFREVMSHHDGSRRLELHLSTTLTTNAIIEGRGDPTHALIIPGPGMSIDDLGLGFPVHVLSGQIDHRGREMAPIRPDEVRAAAQEAVESGATAVALVGKFSHRNPAHELAAARIVHDEFPGLAHVTMGHRLSGRPNFPRRVSTAYLNASVARGQEAFVNTLRAFIAEDSRLSSRIASVYILKADGGTMGLEESTVRPVESVLSGPAASVMAAQALSRPYGNAVVIDIGGTTTDIAVRVDGEPLHERAGARIGGYNTLVPAIFSRSVGLGGDSVIHIDEAGGGIAIGPRRAGTPAALGGAHVTPTDAAVALGLAQVGSKRRAMEAMAAFGEEHGLEPPLSPEQTARLILDTFTGQLVAAVESIYAALEATPVYTVREILVPRDLRPGSVIGLGAPSHVFVPRAAERLGLPCEILPHCESANAIGAAASRPTASVTLHADTALGRLTIPEAGHAADIAHPALFDIGAARVEALIWAGKAAERLGASGMDDVDIVDEESFNVVRDFHTLGHIFNIRAQVRPMVRHIAGGGQE